MYKKFEINQTKIKGGCQSGRKVVPHDSKSDLPLALHAWHCSQFILNPWCLLSFLRFISRLGCLINVMIRGHHHGLVSLLAVALMSAVDA